MKIHVLYIYVHMCVCIYIYIYIYMKEMQYIFYWTCIQIHNLMTFSLLLKLLLQIVNIHCMPAREN